MKNKETHETQVNQKTTISLQVETMKYNNIELNLDIIKKFFVMLGRRKEIQLAKCINRISKYVKNPLLVEKKIFELCRGLILQRFQLNEERNNMKKEIKKTKKKIKKTETKLKNFKKTKKKEEIEEIIKKEEKEEVKKENKMKEKEDKLEFAFEIHELNRKLQNSIMRVLNNNDLEIEKEEIKKIIKEIEDDLNKIKNPPEISNETAQKYFRGIKLILEKLKKIISGEFI